MRKVNINGANNLIEVIRTRSTLEISNIEEYRSKLESILLRTLIEVRREALNYNSIHERVKFITEIEEIILTENKQESNSEVTFLEELNSIKKLFSAELEILKQFLQHFPVTYKSSNKFIIINTIEKPLAFLKSLQSVETINDLKENFYLPHETMGYSVDRKQESASLSFFNEDFNDLEFDSLNAIKKEEYLLRIKNPSNEINITHYFKDELERIVVQNIESSKDVIKQGLPYDTNKQEEYLKELNKVLIPVSTSECESLKKYSQARIKIKEFKEEIAKNGADLFLSFTPVAHLFKPNLAFRSNLHPKNFIIFYNMLKAANLIECEFYDFIFIFQKREINKKIQWKGNDNALYYLISEMISRKIINADFKPNKTEQWKVVENCFLNKKGKAFQAYKLRLLKEPNDKTLLIDILSSIKTT